MAMIRPETEMKDSGVQWLGNIPKEWSVGKVKHEFYATKTIVGDKVNDYERLALTLNGVIKRSKDAGDGLQPEKFDGYQILKEHELVFKLIDLANVSTSRVGLSPYTGIVSPAYIVLHHRKDMNPRYGEYYFLSMWMNEVFNHIGGDGVRSALNAKDLLNIPYLKVSPDEQQAIADYLDETCSKIDEIIAEANASIDEYKELKQSTIDNATMAGIHDSEMKDTNYVWFPEMPKHWNLALASLLFREDVRPVNENDVSLSLSQVDGLIPTDDMSERSLKSATHDNWKHVIPDDLVLNRFKGHLGVFFASRYTGMVSFHYGVYHAIRDDVYAKYYESLFHSTTYKNTFALKSNGITVGLQNLSNGNFYSVKILHPSLDEQKEIVDYLDEKCKQIDSLIAEKESLINDLEAYKKSLIYEVVTGKRRVV